MNRQTPVQRQVLGLLDGFVPEHDRDREAQGMFHSFAAKYPNCCERTLSIGHFTGSAWLVSMDGERVLLTHHRKLDRWLQLGGHADGDGDLAGVALREAAEESGLTDLTILAEIFDLDRHAIPARGSEPGHWHYDVRFVVRALGSEAFAVGEESHDLAWRSISELVADSSVDESVRRMAAKWLKPARQTPRSPCSPRSSRRC
jgi:8-oxo-dGTP pyrophosphatase MutT (NUDIX family)